MAAHLKVREGPNVLAIGFLCLVMGVAAVTDSVDGLATIAGGLASFAVLGLVGLLTIGWNEPRVAFGARADARRMTPPTPDAATLPRGRVLSAAPRPRRTPTV